jgi:hypothetical protein
MANTQVKTTESKVPAAAVVASQLTPSQDAVIEGAGITVESLMLSFKDGKVSVEDIRQMVVESTVSEDEFKAITGKDLSEVVAEPEPATPEVKPGIGHNSGGDPMAMQVLEELSAYKPGCSKAEAEDAIRSAVSEAIAVIGQQDTSIVSRLAIGAANYLALNLAAFDMNAKLVTKLRDAIVKLVPEEERENSNFISQAGKAAAMALLLMEKKATIGWFVLDSSRNAPGPRDTAQDTDPGLVEGKKVFRAVCVPSNVLKPNHCVVHKGSVIKSPNEDVGLTILPVQGAEALCSWIWDRDGRFEYDDTGLKPTGSLIGYTSSLKLQQEAKAKLAKEASEAAAKAKAVVPLTQTNLRNADGTVKELETRAANGTVINAGEPDSKDAIIKGLTLKVSQLQAAIQGKQEAFPAAMRAFVSDTTTRINNKWWIDTLAVSRLSFNRLANLFNDKVPPPEFQKELLDLKNLLDSHIVESAEGSGDYRWHSSDDRDIGPMKA